MKWTTICELPWLEPERGVAALVDGANGSKVAVAVFRLHDDSVYAISNLDPVSGAAVLARGIVGSRGDAPTVASPMHKQVYDLRSGECLDVPGVRVACYAVRLREGMVEVGVHNSPEEGAHGLPSTPWSIRWRASPWQSQRTAVAMSSPLCWSVAAPAWSSRPRSGWYHSLTTPTCAAQLCPVWTLRRTSWWPPPGSGCAAG
jgi:nitrite reductase (NADH) small subunit